MRTLKTAAALGGVGCLLLTGLTASPSWADTSDPSLVSGTATTTTGAPDAGAQVLLLAEPGQAQLKAMQVGDTINVPVIESTSTNTDGSYALPQPADVPDASVTNGQVNYQVVVNGAGTGDYAFSDSDPSSPTSSSSSSTSSVRSLAVKRAHSHRADVHEIDRRSTKLHTLVESDPDLGSRCTKTYKSDYGRQSTTVVKAYSTTNNAKVSVTYTEGASSTLGIGISSTGDSGFSASGSAESTVSHDDVVDLPSDTGKFSDAFNTDFEYGKYFNQCVGTGGSRHWYTAEPMYHYGGSRIANLSSVPSASHCDTYYKGGGQHISDKDATSFSGGVNISKWIGIDLSAKTGYTKQAEVNMHAQNGNISICGTTGPPTNPGVFVAK